MKKVIVVLIAMGLSYGINAQVAMSFGEASKNNIDLQELDSLYQSGIHNNPELGVFNEIKDEYVNAYQRLLLDLSEFLKTNGFEWKQETRAFNRIYFDKNGEIDYFLFNFKPDQITTDEEYMFKQLLNDFSENYHFELTADTKFAQCSPVTYGASK